MYIMMKSDEVIITIRHTDSRKEDTVPRKAKEKTTRFSATIPEATSEAMQELADKYGISVAAILRIFLERGLTLEAVFENGGEVFVRSPDGKVYPLGDDRPHQPSHLLAANEWAKLLKSPDSSETEQE